MTAMPVEVNGENPWTVHFSRIERIRQEVPGIATYELAFEDRRFAKAIAFLPGQFNMMYLPGFGESAISISSDPAARNPWRTRCESWAMSHACLDALANR